MKTKVMVVVVTMLFTLAMVAQTASQAVPATGDSANACACSDHDKADAKSGDKCPMMKGGKMADGNACCGEGCGKDGKCDMAAHKDHTVANGKSGCGEGCCKHGKCNMAAHKDAKAGCGGDKCPMVKDGKAAAAKSSAGCCKTTASASCCKNAAACCKNGNLPCCDAQRSAA